MTSTHRLALAIGCALALPFAASAADKATFQLTDLRRIVSFGDASISPDGKKIAVVKSTPDWKSDKSKQELELVDVATGAQRALTFERQDIGSPAWSPDGSRLAFIAREAKASKDGGKDDDSGDDDDDDGPQDQVFVMRMDGGDPVRVTAAKNGIESFSWSPNGDRIAFVAQDEAPNKKAIKDHDDAFKVTDNHFLMRSAQAPWHLWVVSSAGGDAKRLTHGDFSLQTDEQDGAPPPQWSHDGRSIAFTQFPSSYWGPSFRSTIMSVDAAGGEAHTLIADAGAFAMRRAPEGDALAFERVRGGDQNNGNAVYLSVDGKVHDATATPRLARNYDGYAWLSRNELLLQGDDGTASTLWELPLQGEPRTLDLGGVQPVDTASVSRSGAIAFVGATPSHPSELYVMDSVRAKPRLLTHANDFVEGLALARTESIDWHGPDGFHEDGALTYPVGYQPGRKYPLVLAIHGGPEAASTTRFSSLPQLLAAAGFLVFQPNYRGSTNLGDAYQHAIFRDTGDGPGKDVMAGLEAVKKLGIVDESRIGVSGWSYGGYMTTWLTGHYPETWKAAVAGASLTDWVMDYTISYYQAGDTYFFGGSPWSAKDHDIWRAQSPIASAQNVKAPTLIMGDVGDPNVPLVNSYEWFHALRDAGVEVEFYAYPVDTHFPRDIVRTTDVYRRWVDWMSRHLK